MTHECPSCAQCKAAQSTRDGVDEMAENVRRAFLVIEPDATRHLSEDGARAAVRGTVLAVAFDIVRNTGPRY